MAVARVRSAATSGSFVLSAQNHVNGIMLNNRWPIISPVCSVQTRIICGDLQGELQVFQQGSEPCYRVVPDESAQPGMHQPAGHLDNGRAFYLPSAFESMSGRQRSQNWKKSVHVLQVGGPTKVMSSSSSLQSMRAASGLCRHALSAALHEVRAGHSLLARQA